MNKKLLFGCGIVAVAFLISVVFQDFTLLYEITSFVAIASLILAAMMSGALVSGDRMGRNFNSESKEDRKQRFVTTNTLFLIALPNLLTALVGYGLLN